MKLIVLGAGYATRLYPLTLDQPKPLLTVANKPMIEHILDSLAPIQYINHVYIVTNAKFFSHYKKWLVNYRVNQKNLDFTIVSDKSNDDNNKLGAIGDLFFVITRELIDEDIIVVAGDNLFSQNLSSFGEFCRRKNAPVLAVYDVGKIDEIRKYNSIEVDKDRQIIFFEEKPEHPKSTLTGIALYYYPQSTLSLIKEYIEDGNNPDQPGYLVQWMYQRIPFYTWQVPGIWYDVGSIKSLEEANLIFAKTNLQADL